MGKGKIGALLMACVTMMLCAAMIVGGTYALWSDNVKVINHLSAGSLNVKLERVSLTKTYLDANGHLVTDSNTDVVNFSDPATEGTENSNIFDINEKLVPGSFYEAKLRLTNNGDVAVTYEVIISLTTESNKLAEQLKIYVDDADKGALSEYANNGNAIISAQPLAKEATKEFTVKIVFEDKATNNGAQGLEAKFDLLVKANQATAQA